MFYFLSCCPKPCTCLKLLIESRRPHSDTQQAVVHLWTSDRPVTVVSAWPHTIFTRGRHQFCRRDSNPQSLQASGRITTPSTARPLGSADVLMSLITFCSWFSLWHRSADRIYCFLLLCSKRDNVSVIRRSGIFKPCLLVLLSFILSVYRLGNAWKRMSRRTLKSPHC